MDFIAIGHACHDTAPSGYIPGGAVTYSGLFAHKLGLQTGILSSVGDDYLFQDLFKGILFKSIPADSTTVFQNKYLEKHRQQYLLARANDIKTSHLPLEWRNPKMVFISPIANEVDFDFLNLFNHAICCINPQGWMRHWDSSGKVFHKLLKNYDLLAKATMTIISEEDVNSDYAVINEMADALDILVVTKGEYGCDLYYKKQKTSFPAFISPVSDTTGAGDIFSTAFLVYYYQTGDLVKAAQCANVAASFCIEGSGIENIPNHHQIEKRHLLYLERYD